MRGAILVCGALLGFGSAPALAQAPPPDGAYECLIRSGLMLQPMGKMHIRGGTYRYDPPGGTGRWAPYQIEGEKLRFGGSVGALNEAPARIVESHVERGANYVSIIVLYVVRENAAAETLSCRRE